MKSLARSFLVVGATAMVSILGACAANGGKACCDTGSASAEKVAVINSICPVENDDFTTKERPAELVREIDGQKVGFCCDHCVAKFDKMSAEKKQAVLTAAKANGSI